MTREEAIEELYRIIENQYRSAEKDKEALGMAIEALEQEPRKDNIEILIKYFLGLVEVLRLHGIIHYSDIALIMGTHKQESRKGHWIRVDKDKLRCSECDVIHFIAQYPQGKIAWCPNCGSDNREVDE